MSSNGSGSVVIASAGSCNRRPDVAPVVSASPGDISRGLAGVDKTPLHAGCRALGGKTPFFQNKFERNGTFLLVSAFRPLQKSFLRQRGASQ
jgi:hypothetical protein